MNTEHRLAEQFGGHWGEHPAYPAQSWAAEVEDGSTRIGYWEWVAVQLANAAYCHHRDTGRGVCADCGTFL